VETQNPNKLSFGALDIYNTNSRFIPTYISIIHTCNGAAPNLNINANKIKNPGRELTITGSGWLLTFSCKEKPLVIHKSKVEKEVIPVFKYKIENQKYKEEI
jgi:hypothetical protein